MQVLGGNQTLDTVGVSFNWPLFQGGAVASAVRQSRALYRQAQANYDVGSARHRASDARGVSRTSSPAFSASARRGARSIPGAEPSRPCRRNVEFGTGTEFDLLNAQNNYYAAVRAYSQSRYDYLTECADAQTGGRAVERARPARHRRFAHRDR